MKIQEHRARMAVHKAVKESQEYEKIWSMNKQRWTVLQ